MKFELIKSLLEGKGRTVIDSEYLVQSLKATAKDMEHEEDTKLVGMFFDDLADRINQVAPGNKDLTIEDIMGDVLSGSSVEKRYRGKIDMRQEVKDIFYGI